MNKHPIFFYLAPGAGVLIAALANPLIDHLSALTMDDVFDAPRNAINSLAAGSSQAQTPLDVPQTQPPIGNPGNAATIQPCAAPPMAIAPRPKANPKPVAIIQPAQTIQLAPYVAPSGERVSYNQGGAITQAKADRMSRYSRPQSRKAMLSMLGAPKWFDSGSDVYEIEGSSDGISASRRLVVTYELDPESQFTISHATNWIQQ